MKSINLDKSGSYKSYDKVDASHKNPPNILFILTDQESFFKPGQLPNDYRLKNRERLKARGVSFINHQITSSVCSPSRSSIMTGQHIQNTGVADNLNYPWSQSLPACMPNMASCLNKLGYYSAYKGKWHLSDKLDTSDPVAFPSEKLQAYMEAYGFNDYVGIGDVIGMENGGYQNDDLIAAQACRWLVQKGVPLNSQAQPWFLTVGMVNPHDVMFFNSDGKDTEQKVDGLLCDIQKAPDDASYQKHWQVKLPPTWRMRPEDPGRPEAHLNYQRARGTLVGVVPHKKENLLRLNNYYLNCLQRSDKALGVLLDQLENLGLMDNTIIVLTSDHGELAGSHGLTGKGSTAYAEQCHVPLIVAHPDKKSTVGQHCTALTSHLDLLPTFVSWASKGEAENTLKGKDLTQLLDKGELASVNAIRQYSLYCYNMISYLDPDFLSNLSHYTGKGRLTGPDLSKRGGIRSVFDGRYRFTRYSAMDNFTTPESIEELESSFDMELYDLIKDPDEEHNLALKLRNIDIRMLIEDMNSLLNRAIEQEVEGDDDGSFLHLEKLRFSTTLDQ